MRDLWNYFEDVLRILTGSPSVVEIMRAPILEERDDQIGAIAVVIRYHDGSQLHVHLWADCRLEHVRWTLYSFHYQDVRVARRFRYDNAIHYAALPNFPRHLHVGPPSTERLYPLDPPTLRQIVALVEWHIANPGRLWEPGTLA